MATVVWTFAAQITKCSFYIRGRMEFGIIVANKTDSIIEEIEDDLARWPKIGFPEPLLKGAPHFYRSRHINKRYKLIYRYDEENDTVYIEDIWDTRRSPENLIKRLKIED